MHPSEHRTPALQVGRVSRNLGGIVTGVSLIAMCICLELADFGPSFGPEEVNKLTNSASSIRRLLLGLLSTIFLDVVISWAFHVVFRHVHSDLSLLAAWLRMFYCALFAAATFRLVDALRDVEEDSDISLAMMSLVSFDDSWALSFVVAFGPHIFLIGLLAVMQKSASLLQKLAGGICCIAGVGYVLLNLGKLSLVGVFEDNAIISKVTMFSGAVGELGLGVLLLIQGIRGKL